MAFFDQLACRCGVVNSLIETCVEPLKWIAIIVGFSQLCIVHSEVHIQYPRAVAVEVGNQVQLCDGVVSPERVLVGGKLGSVKNHQDMVAQGEIHIPALVVMVTVFLILLEQSLLVKGGRPLRYGKFSTEVVWADEWNNDEKRILHRLQDEAELDVLSPSAGDLHQLKVLSEETMSLSDGGVFQFTWLIGEERLWEAVDDDIYQQDMRHNLASQRRIMR